MLNGIKSKFSCKSPRLLTFKPKTNIIRLSSALLKFKSYRLKSRLNGLLNKKNSI